MSAIRWLHIYLSMFGFSTLLFFAVTGITLNHASWFGLETDAMEDHAGEMNPAWLLESASTKPDDADQYDVTDRLSVVEHLRNMHRISGAVSDFRVDDTECFVALKGPGFSADAYIERETGSYQLTVSRHGFVAIINDLHKGRDTGFAWSIVIDISAILMTLSSMTGILLLLYLRRIRLSALLTGVVGTILLIAVYGWLVP